MKFDPHALNCPICNGNWDDGDVCEVLSRQDKFKNNPGRLLNAAGNYGWTKENPKRFSKLTLVKTRFPRDKMTYHQCPECEAGWDADSFALIKTPKLTKYGFSIFNDGSTPVLQAFDDVPAVEECSGISVLYSYDGPNRDADAAAKCQELANDGDSVCQFVIDYLIENNSPDVKEFNLMPQVTTKDKESLFVAAEKEIKESQERVNEIHTELCRAFDVHEESYLWLTEDDRGRAARLLTYVDDEGEVVTKRVNEKVADRLIDIGFPYGG